MLMKTILRLSLAVFLLATTVDLSAQSIIIKDSLGNDLSEDTLVVLGTGQEQKLKYVFYVENSTNAVVNGRCVRWEDDVPLGTKNYFCWSLCYGEKNTGDSVRWIDKFPLALQPDTVYRNLAAYHKPYGATGPALYRYKLWNSSDANDTTSIHVLFDIPLGIFDAAAERPSGEVRIAPNPADNWVNFNYKGNADGTNRQLVVFDLLGNQVAVEPLPYHTGKITLDTGDYSAGIYVMSLRENGQLIATKKLVVDR